ncbi:phosphotransferase family enzyme [Motilibacter rhizosphaerae]|uniref:Phosphotransferase family enzyme n=1 Tax=Motilibacter rhizosphaerae TaxID=598652 RepID=A0A4Q7NW01_9ACTN|nr:aminoglycoside phosphotransferase family protein [Motilibacter rhizosphaerae]RZS91375.1 phosphotransferase family enzyme [Motilibacter rhizosphaerae]
MTAPTAVLRRHGLVPTAADVALQPLHQRSWCYRAQAAPAPAVLVKQARQDSEGGWSADVVDEGRRLRAVARLLPTPPVAPRVLHVDAEDRLLVTEFLNDHDPLDVAVAARPDVLDELGRTLATLHGVRGARCGLPVVEHARSVTDGLLAPTPRTLARYPDGYAELLVAVRARGLAGPLTELVAEWHCDTLVHGDLKSNNILCSRGSSAVRLIDWETAGWGDGRWDLGCLVGDLLFGWLAGLRFSAGGTLDSWLASGEPFDVVQTRVRRLLAAYRSGGRDLSADDELVCLRYAALFLLQRTASAAMHAPALPALALAGLHVAGSLLRRPAELRDTLL